MRLVRVLLIVFMFLGVLTFVQDSLVFPMIGAGSLMGFLVGIGGLVVSWICWHFYKKLFGQREELKQESDSEWARRELKPLLGEKK